MLTPLNSVRTFDSLLERHVTERGSDVFFRYQDQTCTYAELNERATAVANELYDQHVSSGDIVALYMYNCPEYLYTLFALAKIGAIAAPIDTRFIGESLTHVLSQTESDIILLDSNTQEEYNSIRNDVSMTAEFFIGQTDENSFRDFNTLLDGAHSETFDVDVAGTDPCSVIYIRRYRQGDPQGVVLPHYSYVRTGITSARDILGLSQEDCIFTTLPLYSSYPIQMGVAGALSVGAEFAFEKQFDETRFWDWIRRHDATVFLYLGRMLSVLHNHHKTDQNKSPAAYAIGHGFENDETVIENFEERFGITVLEAYGITPTATLATSNRVEDRRIGSVGKAVPQAEIKIVDENGWEVPPEESGEILVRPTEEHTMMRGFLSDPELTVEQSRNQWIHTNDIGYIDEDGYLHFVANKTNTIHLGRVGGRISSLEIETVIESHPDIRESAVLGIKNEEGQEDIKAAVVPVKNAEISPIEISEYCEKQLTYYNLPRYIEIVPEIPRSPTGKVRKDELQSIDSSKVWSRDDGYELLR